MHNFLRNQNICYNSKKKVYYKSEKIIVNFKTFL